MNLNKPLLGILIGSALGLLDGLAAPLQAPEIQPEAAFIALASTFKGLVVGLVAGFFARKVESTPLGIAVGLGTGLLFAYLVASQPDELTGRHYYREIMLPGALAGALVGWVTQRYGRRSAAAAALLLLALVPASALRAEGPAADGAAAFARLKALAGDWQGHVTAPDGPPARVEYRLSGNGSTLVEKLFPGTDHEMVTVYHMRGSDLVLTHYCAMGNQPRMKLVSGGATGDLDFAFEGGDNIDPATTQHMHSGHFALAGDRFEAAWDMQDQGKSVGEHRFFMQRAAKAPR